MQLKRRSGETRSQSRKLTMKITYLLAALLLVSSLATPTTAQEQSRRKNVARTGASLFIDNRELNDKA
jgi:uncharacterized lipoprotein YajG